MFCKTHLTINEFCESIASFDCSYRDISPLDEVKIYVFRGEGNFMDFCHGSDEVRKGIEILFTICSPFRPSYYLQDRFYNAKVLRFAAINTNEFAVEIETDV